MTMSRRNEVEDGQLASIHERNEDPASPPFNGTPSTVSVAGCPARGCFMRRKSGLIRFDHAADDTGALNDFGKRFADQRDHHRAREVSGPLVRGTR